MNRTLSSLVDYIVKASDGDVGKVGQFYFDDLTWTIRYLSVKTGRWLPGRKILISLAALGKPDWDKRVFPVNLTKEQVRSSPKTNGAEPVSRQHEIELHEHYVWPFYWGGFYIPQGYGTDATISGDVEIAEETPAAGLLKGDPHLRATQEVIQCRVHAVDGSIGNVEDFLVDDETWTIRYLVVNMEEWLPGRRVLVSPRWVTSVSWSDKEVFVNLQREAIKKSPKFDHLKPISLDYERKLLGHLQKPDAKEWVVFKFHAPPKTEVHVAGTFNNWDATAIKLGYSDKGTYTAMVLLPLGRCEYKFIVNGEWRNSPSCSDLVPNAFGTANSVLVVGRTAAHAAHRHTFSRLSGDEGQLQWSSPVRG